MQDPTPTLDPQRHPDYYLVSEVAQKLRVSPKTVRKLILSKQLEATRVGTAYRISAQALEDYKQRASTLHDVTEDTTVVPIKRKRTRVRRGADPQQAQTLRELFAL
ncbi:MAG: Helix-turn-helix domain [Conexibacter sp.]|nr:Helix-turn-helix domain [Conexibacter sp.]